MSVLKDVQTCDQCKFGCFIYWLGFISVSAQVLYYQYLDQGMRTILNLRQCLCEYVSNASMC